MRDNTIIMRGPLTKRGKRHHFVKGPLPYTKAVKWIISQKNPAAYYLVSLDDY